MAKYVEVFGLDRESGQVYEFALDEEADAFVATLRERDSDFYEVHDTDPRTRMAEEQQGWPVGQTIVGIEPLSDIDREREGWDTARYGETTAVLVLSDGSRIYPSQDPEGNGPGELFALDADGQSIGIAIVE